MGSKKRRIEKVHAALSPRLRAPLFFAQLYMGGIGVMCVQRLHQQAARAHCVIPKTYTACMRHKELPSSDYIEIIFHGLAEGMHPGSLHFFLSFCGHVAGQHA